MLCHMSGQTSDDDHTLTIDELARETGVTVRNIRAHQARGLLPPPVVRARTGFYGPDHRARLELIQDLQSEGVKLETIRKLLATTGGSTEQVLRFLRTVRGLFSEPEGEILDLPALAERFGTDDPGALRRAQKMGLLRAVDGEQYQEVSPRLLAAGEALVGVGIPVERSLDVVAQLRRYADGVARLYVQVFLDEVWRPFDESGRPDEGWAALHETIQELRRVSGDAFLAVLQTAVSERLDVTFGREITRNVRASRDGS